MKNNTDTGGKSRYYKVREDMTAGELVVETGRFDPRTRPWYKAAKESGKTSFSPLYKHFVLDDLTVSVGTPVYDKEGSLIGVLGTHITLSRMDQYLNDIVKRNGASAVIVDKNTGELVANSLQIPNFKVDADGSLKMTGINEINNSSIIRGYENYLANNDEYQAAWIAGKIGITTEEVRKAMQLIRTLNPKPGSAISAASPCSYVVPDITVRKVDGEYLILINDSQVPGLRVNPYYKKMARDSDGDARKFIEGRIGSALWLIRSIEQRRQTLHKVMQTIIELQPNFFEVGARHLLPMTMKQVADRVGVHESTVSRATANKYVATSHGLFSLRSFFSAGVSAVDGSTMSATRVKREIRELIMAEDSTHPLSDQALTELLTKQGIAVSRRTVAKYREELEILPSCRRKK